MNHPLPVHLKIFVDPQQRVLLALYQMAVEKHNQEVVNNPYPNAGFDLILPSTNVFSRGSTYWVDNRIKASMTTEVSSTPYHPSSSSPSSSSSSSSHPSSSSSGSIRRREPTGFCLYPRSSLSKTPLMLANHVGIIDSGYSGFLIGAFRHIMTPESYVAEEGTRLLQICHPTLKPFTVELVNHEEKLFPVQTSRGDGGFGSTDIDTKDICPPPPPK